MQDPELQAATASEPLTLEEEYAMQRSWREEGDKLTFIVCLPAAEGEVVEAGVHDGEDRMVGDVNVFLSRGEVEDDEEEEDEEVQGEGEGEVHRQDSKKDEAAIMGEIELMIALPHLQGQGYGRAALLTFMTYIFTHWDAIAAEFAGLSTTPLAYLRARIHEGNVRSIGLFESVGFKREGKRNWFGEVELRWKGNVEGLRWYRGWEEGREVRYEGGE